MASPWRALLPWATHGVVRDQLGSIRSVYAGRDQTLRRHDFRPDGANVLLLHGFFQTRNLWNVMEDRLRFDGYSVMSFHLGQPRWRFNTAPIDRIAEQVAEKIERLSDKIGFDDFHIIGHSKGGLIARSYIQRFGGEKRVRSLITLGTPHHGTPTAALAVALMGFGAVRSSASQLLPRSRTIRNLARIRFPDHIPLTSIYSRADLVCPYVYSDLSPRDHHSRIHNIMLDGIGHSELAWNPLVYRHVIEALNEGQR